MNNRPLHENLDTSFVNLSALVRYLRRRQFTGSVLVKLAGYDGEISFSADGEMRIREHDSIAGRIAEGEEALQRLLIRAREPGGIVNVYEAVEEAIPLPAEKIEPPAPENFIVQPKETIVELVAETPHKNGNSKAAKIEMPVVENNSPQPKFPFAFSNNYEAKARPVNLDPSEWQMLLNLTAELLRTVDRTIAEANLDFTAAFEKARTEISGDYPFLNPSANIFDYRDGKIIVRRQINAKLFAASINEALRRILEKLGRNPKFANVYRTATENIFALLKQRKPLYDKFTFTPALEKIIGVSD